MAYRDWFLAIKITQNISNFFDFVITHGAIKNGKMSYLCVGLFRSMKHDALDNLICYKFVDTYLC